MTLHLIMKMICPIKKFGIALFYIFLINLWYTEKAMAAQGINDNGIQGLRWINQYQEDEVYNYTVVEPLNDVETLAAKSESFHLENADIELLTTTCNDKIPCLRNKARSLIKYKGKIEAVQCMNAVILKPVVSELLLDQENVANSDIIKWRTTVERMISLLLHMKVPAHNWLWELYLRLVPDAYLSNNDDSKANTVKRLNDDLTQHLDLCRLHGYLPRDCALQSSNRSNEIATPGIELSRALYDNPSAESTWLKRVYDTARTIWTKFSSTMKCGVDQHQNVIRKIPGVNWEDTKLLVNSCTYSLNRQPPLEQMLRSHEPALRAIKTMLLLFVWKHCAVLKILIDLMAVEDALPKIRAFQTGILQSLKITVTGLNIRDLVFRNVIKILNTDIVDESHNRWFHTQLDEMNGELKDIIKADLFELGAHLYDENSVFNVPKNIPLVIDDEVDLKWPHFFDNIRLFEDYIKNVREAMLPVDFYLLNSFFDSKRSLCETFFIVYKA